MQIEIKQEQQLSARQLQSLQVLQMSRIDLLRCLNTLAEENPVVDLETPAAEETFSDTADDLERRLHWLEDVGPGPGRTAYAPEEETLSPVDRIGTDGGLWETLPLFLRRQIADLPVSRTDKALLCYLSDCLDDDGYMRFSDAELAEGLSAPEEQVSRGMARLRRLEPAGIGARDLPQCLLLQLAQGKHFTEENIHLLRSGLPLCLLLQLERLGDESAAVPIVREYLEPLGRGRFRAIAAALGIPEEEVRRALAKIRQLDPYPGRQFCRAERPAHILPDILVTEQDGVYVCDESRVTRAEFRISSFYRQLYDTTDDPEVRQYLKGKLQQADHMLRAVHQRRSTLLRCGMFIARHQQDFFRLGSRGLHPLCMADAAAELELHVSTISRALKDKYLQCAWGVFPMDYFFSGNAVSGGDTTAGSACALLRELVAGEDRGHPLSDEALCAAMKAQGCDISRRTVAKYRQQLGIPNSAQRMLGL